MKGRMDCQTFEDRLESLQAGRLSAAESEVAKEHLAECRRCSRLLLIVEGKLDLLPAHQERELRGRILRRTSGPACLRVRRTLVHYVDTAVGPERARRIFLHLSDCQGCSSLAATLARLDAELPELTILEPDERFTRAVLAATVGQRESGRGRLESRPWWASLLERPRFSWEAAYVGTLLIFIVLGTSGLSFRHLTSGPIAVSTNLMEKLDFPSEILFAGREKARGGASRVAGEVEKVWTLRRQRIERFWRSLHAQAREKWQVLRSQSGEWITRIERFRDTLSTRTLHTQSTAAADATVPAGHDAWYSRFIGNARPAAG
ncbi:MAG: hypothetical protein ACE5JX_10585 [Acidobacteriota bacterium]